MVKPSWLTGEGGQYLTVVWNTSMVPYMPQFIKHILYSPYISIHIFQLYSNYSIYSSYNCTYIPIRLMESSKVQWIRFRSKRQLRKALAAFWRPSWR